MSSKDHVVLVALTVTDSDGTITTAEAQDYLAGMLPRPTGGPGVHVSSWWIAQDDRRDGSDNDSAVFVTPGNAGPASVLLLSAGLASEGSNPDWTSPDVPRPQVNGAFEAEPFALKHIEVRPCFDDGEETRTVTDDDAEFWTVYERWASGPNAGLAFALSDHSDRPSAITHAREVAAFVGGAQGPKPVVYVDANGQEILS